MHLHIITLTLLFLLNLEIASMKQNSNLSSSASSTVPAFPLGGQNGNKSTFCKLDLSSEMFGGVEEACGHSAKLDRSRCCPVLAAWLFAAHARTALAFQPSSLNPKEPSPLMPETDSKRCADALQTSLAARNISLPRPNATCDAALCFCGIHLHEITSSSCSAQFNLSASTLELQKDCADSSYAGCTRCLNTLERLNGARSRGGGERMGRMMDRDCQIMGVTWLLWRNKTAYIPTVSAVLRAIFYSVHPPSPPYKCSLDQDNMPLAVDSVQVQQAGAAVDSSVSTAMPCVLLVFALVFFAAGLV